MEQNATQMISSSKPIIESQAISLR